MRTVMIVFVGGGLGSVVRYLLSKAYGSFNLTFPFATLTANFLSCIIFGFATGYLLDKQTDSDFKLFLLTGFCGGFSTFSTFAFETNHLATTHSALAVVNIILNFTLSISALLIGSWIAKLAH